MEQHSEKFWVDRAGQILRGPTKRGHIPIKVLAVELYQAKSDWGLVSVLDFEERARQYCKRAHDLDLDRRPRS